MVKMRAPPPPMMPIRRRGGLVVDKLRVDDLAEGAVGAAGVNGDAAAIAGRGSRR